MGTVIAAAYKIKAHALISRVFRQLYIDIDEEFECLLLHTEIKWRLSKRNVPETFLFLFTV